MSTLKQSVEDGATHLLALIKQLIKEKQYEGVALLFSSNKEAKRNLQYLPKIAMNIYNEICRVNLNEKVYQENNELFTCADQLLVTIAAHAPLEELQLELLDIVESSKRAYIFTCALKALQILLLRQGDHKPRALEWTFNSIYTRLNKLPVPNYLKEGYDVKQQLLLEQDYKIENLFLYYVTLKFFYDPLITVVCGQSRKDDEIFRSVGFIRRNIICCFLIGLLGKPISLLDLSKHDEKRTNIYSLKCATSFTESATKCIVDPMYLLSYVEARFKRAKNEGKGVHEMSSCNIFVLNEKLPLDCLAIYYYMVIVVGIGKERIPLVYHPIYIFESCLYLVYELLQQDEPPLHEKGLLLMRKTLENLHQHVIAVSSLELEIHKLVCIALCNVIIYSGQIHIRRLGIKVLHKYIICFDDEGKYLVIKNLLKSVNHHGIAGYLITLYKDLVAEALKKPTELPSTFCGNDFRCILRNDICVLPQGVETDLLESSDKIISTLNTLRYFALKDDENRTGFWNFALEIGNTYMSTLRKGLDLAVAHFKAELHKVEVGVEDPQLNQLNVLGIEVANDKKTKLDIQLDRNKKIRILKQNLCVFDLMFSLWSRVCECLEKAEEVLKKEV